MATYNFLPLEQGLLQYDYNKPWLERRNIATQYLSQLTAGSKGI